MQNFATKYVIVIILIAGAISFSVASPPVSDFSMLFDKEIDEKKHLHSHDVKFMRTRSDNFFIRNNPVSLLFGGLMYTYQRYISLQLPAECLYVHNCSNFSRDLIYRYGLVKGIFTTSDRLMRCNRISALDVHPLMIDENSGKVREETDVYK